MPLVRSTTNTEYDLTEPIVLSTQPVYLSGPDDARSVVVETVTVIKMTNATGSRSQQILITGYVLDADGQRTGARVYATPVTDPDQIINLLAHIAQEN